MLDFDVIDSWEGELTGMNNGKVGEPYDYPDSFILLLGYMRAYFHLPYRQTQGVVRAHAGAKVPQYRIIVQLADVSINWKSESVNILEITSSLPLPSSTFFLDPYNQSDTYRIEESESFHHSKGDIAE